MTGQAPGSLSTQSQEQVGWRHYPIHAVPAANMTLSLTSGRRLGSYCQGLFLKVLNKGKRTVCGQAGKGPGKCMLPWFGKGSVGELGTATINWNR